MSSFFHMYYFKFVFVNYYFPITGSVVKIKEKILNSPMMETTPPHIKNENKI